MKLEICIASVDDAIVSEQFGADRVELNSALALGGLTPSLGSLIEARAAIRIPIIAMIRPRQGGFCYSAKDFEVMLRDAALCAKHGADGIAFGILLPDGRLDVPRCKELMEVVAGKELVFHRAFDVVPNPFETMEELIALGVKRIMTSGQEASAYNGAIRIAQLIAQAKGRIEILPAGGINQYTIKDVIERTGCNQIHASLTGTKRDASTMGRPQVSFGGTFAPPEDAFKGTSERLVTEIKKMVATHSTK